jgi:hypothetical protein
MNVREGGSDGGLRIIHNEPAHSSVSKPRNSRGWLVFCFLWGKLYLYPYNVIGAPFLSLYFSIF